MRHFSVASSSSDLFIVKFRTAVPPIIVSGRRAAPAVTATAPTARLKCRVASQHQPTKATPPRP